MPLDAFLQIKNPGVAGPEIEGETQDKVMRNEKPRPFDLSNWSFGVTQEVNVGSGSGGIGAGKVVFDSFKVTKAIDKASQSFFKTCCSGGHYKDAILLVRKAGSGAGGKTSGEPYLKFEFKMVFVSNISWANAEPAPTEDITFDYGALQIAYSPQKPDGALDTPIMSSWSRVKNSSEFAVE